ncbi:hypothetical protein ACHWQZ_G009263 [Mnemiopsis leidyi]
MGSTSNPATTSPTTRKSVPPPTQLLPSPPQENKFHLQPSYYLPHHKKIGFTSNPATTSPPQENKFHLQPNYYLPHHKKIGSTFNPATTSPPQENRFHLQPGTYPPILLTLPALFREAPLPSSRSTCLIARCIIVCIKPAKFSAPTGDAHNVLVMWAVFGPRRGSGPVSARPIKCTAAGLS